MSNVARWTRLLTALLGAVGILVAGVVLSRVGVIENQSVALWPTYDLLHVETLRGPGSISTMWFPFAVQVFVWTAILFALLALGERLQRR
jgi:hypothetical protein